MILTRALAARASIKPQAAVRMGLLDFFSTATTSKGPSLAQQRAMSSKQLVEVRSLRRSLLIQRHSDILT